MAFVDVTRGLTDLRRQLRNSDHSLRDYNGRTQMFVGGAKTTTLTPQRQIVRKLMQDAAAAWRALDEDSKQAWRKYAAQYGEVMGEQKYKDFSAWDVYQPAYRNRTLISAAPAERPMSAAPPSTVTGVEEIPSGDDRTFTFRILHSLAPAGYMLLARITPKTFSVGRKPVTRELRLICGHSSESLQPLPSNNGTVTFTNAQYAIAPGERYGLELRSVRTADGVHSKAVFLDLTRKGEIVSESPVIAPGK